MLRDEADRTAREIATLRAIYDDHAGLQDRFRGAGTLKHRVAKAGCSASRAGRRGLRATSAAICLARPTTSWIARRYTSRRRGRRAGRIDEIVESIRLCRMIIAIGLGSHFGQMPADRGGPTRARRVEGWRGPVLVALESGPDGSVRRCHPHDPSWSNWPVLEHAVIGNIVPDFPLINKSFNLSYSGHDLEEPGYMLRYRANRPGIRTERPDRRPH